MKFYKYFQITLTICILINTLADSSFESINYNKRNKQENDLSSTLLSVIVIFRHGQKITDRVTDYPTSPYKNHSFYPYSSGDLTMEGQKTMIEQGLLLKNRYKSILGERYYTDLIKSTSSSYVRCQLSLQAMHAGLFWTNEWNAIEGLPWQAVPYDVLSAENDYVSAFKRCPSILYKLKFPPLDYDTQVIFEYIKKYSGWDDVGYIQALTLYVNTQTNLELGLPPPEWLQKIYPEPLRALGIKFWKFVADQKLRIGAGPLLEKIVEHAKLSEQESNIVEEHVNGRNERARYKTRMLLFSGHDLTIHFLLNALNCWRDEVVEYGALLIFEVHKIDGIVGFKVYYENRKQLLDFKTPIYIPNCGLFCALQKFSKLLEHTYNPTPVCN